jgi:hypothetical protein
MKKLCLLLTTLITNHIITYSQTITGTITDDSKPLEFINVILHRAADSVFVKG